MSIPKGRGLGGVAQFVAELNGIGLWRFSVFRSGEGRYVFVPVCMRHSTVFAHLPIRILAKKELQPEVSAALNNGVGHARRLFSGPCTCGLTEPS